MSSSERVRAAGSWRTVRGGLSGFEFMVAAVVATAASITALSVVVGVLYHWSRFGSHGPVDAFTAGGALVAFLYLLPNSTRSRLSLEQSLGAPQNLARLLFEWVAAFALLAVIMVLTKSATGFSRGWMIAFFAAGLFVVPFLDFLVRGAALILIARGAVEPQRVFVLSARGRVPGGLDGGQTVRIVGRHEFDFTVDGLAEADVLAEAVQMARLLRVEDVVLDVPGERRAFIRQAVEAFSALPVSIHLDLSSLGRMFGHLSAHRIGAMTTVSLDAAPLSPGQRLVKRMFDIVVASLGLILLAPLLLATALVIAWDSNGGVLYRQRRRGYNQREFTILKFRTMRVGHADSIFRQATLNDDRITPVGRWLRRSNLDELPQLVNVLMGDMSIVGPRPHAVVHDLQFEDRIRLYPRRLNVRPGITGWAQIHGFRGETDTDAKMAARVEHDLHYIDNWSLALDLYIILATIVSPRSYRNAR